MQTVGRRTMSVLLAGLMLAMLGAVLVSGTAVAGASTPTSGWDGSANPLGGKVPSVPNEDENGQALAKIDAGLRALAERPEKGELTISVLTTDLAAAREIAARHGAKVGLSEEFDGTPVGRPIRSVGGSRLVLRDLTVPQSALLEIAKLPSTLSITKAQTPKLFDDNKNSIDYKEWEAIRPLFREKMREANKGGTRTNSGDPAPRPFDYGTAQVTGSDMVKTTYGYTGEPVNIMVLDTGTDFAHPNFSLATSPGGSPKWATVNDPANAWDGWPIMSDAPSLELWLAQWTGGLPPYPLGYSVGESTWYSDLAYEGQLVGAPLDCTVDGDPTGWDPAHLVATDPAEAGNGEYDLTDLYVSGGWNANTGTVGHCFGFNTAPALTNAQYVVYIDWTGAGTPGYDMLYDNNFQMVADLLISPTAWETTATITLPGNSAMIGSPAFYLSDGTMFVDGVDYTYNAGTGVVTFTQSLYPGLDLLADYGWGWTDVTGAMPFTTRNVDAGTTTVYLNGAVITAGFTLNEPAGMLTLTGFLAPGDVLEVDYTFNAGGDYDPWYGAISSAPTLPEVIAFWSPVSMTEPDVYFWSGQMTAWDGPYAISAVGGEGVFNAANNFAEFFAPKPNRGDPQSISVEMYSADTLALVDTTPTDGAPLSAFTNADFGFLPYFHGMGGWATKRAAPDLGDNSRINRNYHLDLANPLQVSASGVYHLGVHPDDYLTNIWGERVGVLVVDTLTPGVYDTMFVDVDDDHSFADENAVTKSSPAVWQDVTGDGIPDISGGVLYFLAEPSTAQPMETFTAVGGEESLTLANGWVAVDFTAGYAMDLPTVTLNGTALSWQDGSGAVGFDMNFDTGEIFFWTSSDGGATYDPYALTAGDTVTATYSTGIPLPYAPTLAAMEGLNDFIPANGDIALFYGEFAFGQGHGTATASAAGGKPYGNPFSENDIWGTAEDARLIGGNFAGSTVSLEFAALGYDGIAGTGDEAQIVSNSWGFFDDSTFATSGYDANSRYLQWLSDTYPETTYMFAASNEGWGYGTIGTPAAAPDVIAVTAAGMMNYRRLLGSDGGPLGCWPIFAPAECGPYGDMANFGARGPTALGQPKPDLLAPGAFGFAALPLNSLGYWGGIYAVDLFSGTSWATPVAAGVAALAVESYWVSHGKTWPTNEMVKEFMMSGATDHKFDSLQQGAGFVDALSAVRLASTPSVAWGQNLSWALGDQTGTSETDLSGHANTGTITGVSNPTSGICGSGLVFDGSTTSISAADSPSLRVTQGISISFWMNAASYPSNAVRLVQKDLIVGGPSWSQILFYGDPLVGIGRIAFRPNDDSVGLSSTSLLRLNTWYHVAATYDVATGIATLYINGVEEDQMTLAGPIPAGAAPLLLGRNGPVTQYFDGTLDEFQLFNRTVASSMFSRKCAPKFASVSPSSWVPGGYPDPTQSHVNFVNLLRPGQSDTDTFTVTNHGPAAATPVVSDAYYIKTGTYEWSYIHQPVGTEYWTFAGAGSVDSRYRGSGGGFTLVASDFPAATYANADFIAIHVSNPEIDRMNAAGDSHTLATEVYQWTDTNNNSIFGGAGERNRVTTGDGFVGDYNAMKLWIREPANRFNNPTSAVTEGFVIRVADFAPGMTFPLTVVIEFYERSDWPWVTVTQPGSIASGATGTFTATASVPLGTPAGAYQGVLMVDLAGTVSIIPSLINVPYTGFPARLGDMDPLNPPATSLYENSAFRGAGNFQYTLGGDNRYFYVELDVDTTRPDRTMLYQLDWQSTYTDAELWAAGASPYAAGSPEALDEPTYGPHSMAIVASSKGSRGNQDANTGNQEFIAGPLQTGLMLVTAEALRMEGNDVSEDFTIDVGMIEVKPSVMEISTNQLAGSQPVSVWANVPLHSGLSAAVTEVQVDTFSGRTIADYPYPGGSFATYLLNAPSVYSEMLPAGMISLRWQFTFFVSSDTDFGVFYDGPTCDGAYSEADIVGGTQAATGANPENLAAPDFSPGGCYWIHAAGYSGGGTFDERRDITKLGVSAFTADNCPTTTVAPLTLTGCDIGWDFLGSTPQGAQTGTLFLGPGYAPFALAHKLTVNWRYDAIAPTVGDVLPLVDSVTQDATPDIVANVYDEATRQIRWQSLRLWLDGVDITQLAKVIAPYLNGYNAVTASYTPTTPLADGVHTVRVSAMDYAGNEVGYSWSFTVDTTGPSLTVTSPAVAESAQTGASATFAGTTDPGATVAFDIGGTSVAATVDPQGRFSGSVALVVGENLIDVIASDSLGNANSESFIVWYDNAGPTLTWIDSGTLTNAGSITLRGTASEPVTLWVNGLEVPVFADGSWSASVILAEGANAISLRAADMAGQQISQTVTVTRVTSAPAVDAHAEQAGAPVTTILADPTENTVDIVGTATVAMAAINNVRYVSVNGQPVNSTATGGFSLTGQTLNVGSNTFVIEVEDDAGNVATSSVTVTYSPVIQNVRQSYTSLIMGGVAIVLFLVGLMVGWMVLGGKKPPEPEMAPMPPMAPMEAPMAPMETPPASPSPEELPPNPEAGNSQGGAQ